MDARKLLDTATAELDKLQNKRIGFRNYAKELKDELTELLAPGSDTKQILGYRDKIVKWLATSPDESLDSRAFRTALLRVLAILSVNKLIPAGETDPFTPELQEELREKDAYTAREKLFAPNQELLFSKVEADLQQLQEEKGAERLLADLKKYLEAKPDKKQAQEFRNQIVAMLTPPPEENPHSPAFRKALFRILAVLAINELITNERKEEPFDLYTQDKIEMDHLFVAIPGTTFDIRELINGIKQTGEWKNCGTNTDFSPIEQEAIKAFAKDLGKSLEAKDLPDPTAIKLNLTIQGAINQAREDDSSYHHAPLFSADSPVITQLSQDIGSPIEDLFAYELLHPSRFISLLIASPYIKELKLSIAWAKNLTRTQCDHLDLSTLPRDSITLEELKSRIATLPESPYDEIKQPATATPQTLGKDSKSAATPPTSPPTVLSKTDSDLLNELSKATGRSIPELVILKQENKHGFANVVKLLPYLKEGLLEPAVAENLDWGHISILRLDNIKDPTRAIMLERMEIAGIAPPISDQKHQAHDSKRKSIETKNAVVETKVNAPTVPRAKTPPTPTAPTIDPAVVELSAATKKPTEELLKLQNTSPQKFKNLHSLLPYFRESKFTLDYAMKLEIFQIQLLTEAIEFKTGSSAPAALMNERMTLAGIPIPTTKNQDDRKASPTRTDAKRQDDSKEGYIKRLTDFITVQKNKPKEPSPQWYQVWHSAANSSEINQAAATKMIALINGEKPKITEQDFDAFKSGELGKIIAEMKSKEKLPAEFLSQEKMYVLQTRKLL